MQIYKSIVVFSYTVIIHALLIAVSPVLAQENAPPAACESSLALDWNCDGAQRITVLGDSFVAGVGDSNLQKLNGYIGRSNKALPKVKIDGFGTKGQQTGQLLGELEDIFDSKESSNILESLLTADVVVLDLGRNDRWLFGLPSEALKNLKTIRQLIQSTIKERTGISPVVIIAVLMLPNRGAQGPWVKELNGLIQASHKTTAPANLRFDLVSKRLIGSDQIHPTSRGYVELSKTFVSYLKKNLPALLRKLKSRP